MMDLLSTSFERLLGNIFIHNFYNYQGREKVFILEKLFIASITPSL